MRTTYLFRPLAIAGVLAALVPSPASQSPTVWSNATGPSVDCPNASGRFEDPAITTFAFFTPSATWQSWTMNNVGIARNGFGPAAIQNAPDGACAAYVPGTGSLQTSFTFPAGAWRLRFFGAQRKVGTTVDAQRVRVSIGTTQVFEEVLLDDTYRPYVTRALVFGAATPLSVTIQGLASAGDVALLDRIEAEPLALWDQDSTWTGPPTATDEIEIKAGSVVALVGDVSVLAITVKGELVVPINESPTLTTEWLAVAGADARFEVGQFGTPHEGTFELTLTGDPTTTNAHMMGSKFLGALDGGVIEMHGKPKTFLLPDGRRRAWTRLDADAPIGTQTLRLETAVPWEVGDEIVITGTNFGDPFVDQSEVHVIQAIALNGQDVTIAASQGTTYAHTGQSVTVGPTPQRQWTLDRRAEVGLLSHNVVVQGDVTSPQTGDGAHVMMMWMPGGCCGAVAGQGRFSSVQFRRMGQRARLGRYPVHWHMIEAQGATQFMKWCSVQESYNRATTIHGTEYVVLEGNVYLDHLGHGVFLEDGSERFNGIYHNLALRTVRPSAAHALLPTDHLHAQLQNKSPSTYWITNPNNHFVGNVAAGTVGTGFWFALPMTPLGMSANRPHFAGLQPHREPLGTFTDNLAHSSGTGLDLNDSIDTSHNLIGNVDWAPPGTAPVYLDRFSVYGCGVGIYAGSGEAAYERQRFRDCVLGDNGVNIAFANSAFLEESAVIARTAPGLQGPVAGAYLVYDGPGRIYDCHFEGFHDPYEPFFVHIGAAVRNVNHRFKGLTFNPSGTPAIFFGNFTPSGVGSAVDSSHWGVVVVDEDGTLVNAAVPPSGVSIVSNHPMMRSQYEAAAPEWYYPAPNPFIPGAYATIYPFAHLLVVHPALGNASPTIQFERHLAGYADVTFLHDDVVWPHRQIPVIINPGGVAPFADYEATWTNLPSTSPIEIVLDDLERMPAGMHLAIALKPIGNLPILQVQVDGVVAQPAGSLNALMSGTSTGYFIDNATFWVRFVSSARRHTVRIAW